MVKVENDDLASGAFEFCRNCIFKRKLEMKLVDVEVYFDRSKMVFYFTAPGRIDFRDLVKDLVRQYRTRIELRQIGVRHETQMLGAMGNCGQVCCCRRFMRKFHPVTIKMAKEQNLFLNPTKISGICGRLLCCLGFEQKNYEEFHRDCPKIGKKFTTSIGRVKVIRSNFFKRSLSIITEGGDDHEVSLEEWERLVNMEPPQEIQESRRSAPPQAGARRAAQNGGKAGDKAPAAGGGAPKGGGVFGLKPETDGPGETSRDERPPRNKAEGKNPRRVGRKTGRPKAKNAAPDGAKADGTKADGGRAPAKSGSGRRRSRKRKKAEPSPGDKS